MNLNQYEENFMNTSETLLKSMRSVNGISLMENDSEKEAVHLKKLIDSTIGLIKLCHKILEDESLNLNEYYEGKFIILSSYLQTLFNELRINGSPKRLAITYYLVGLLECLRYDIF